jgi:hypothetical protein
MKWLIIILFWFSFGFLFSLIWGILVREGEHEKSKEK